MGDRHVILCNDWPCESPPPCTFPWRDLVWARETRLPCFRIRTSRFPCLSRRPEPDPESQVLNRPGFVHGRRCPDISPPQTRWQRTQGSGPNRWLLSVSWRRSKLQAKNNKLSVLMNCTSLAVNISWHHATSSIITLWVFILWEIQKSPHFWLVENAFQIKFKYTYYFHTFSFNLTVSLDELVSFFPLYLSKDISVLIHLFG